MATCCSPSRWPAGSWRTGEKNAEFDEFFEMHPRKIIALRREGPDDDRRYLSKNNVDLGRLGAPPAPLRGGTFLIPFREPLQHAASIPPGATTGTHPGSRRKLATRATRCTNA